MPAWMRFSFLLLCFISVVVTLAGVEKMEVVNSVPDDPAEARLSLGCTLGKRCG